VLPDHTYFLAAQTCVFDRHAEQLVFVLLVVGGEGVLVEQYQFRVICTHFREVGKILSNRSDQAGLSLHPFVIGHRSLIVSCNAADDLTGLALSPKPRLDFIPLWHRCTLRLVGLLSPFSYTVGEWMLNALLTTSSSYRKCSKRRTLDHSAQATSLLQIEGTTRRSLIARGFGSGNAMASVAEPSLQCSNWENRRARPLREFIHTSR